MERDSLISHKDFKDLIGIVTRLESSGQFDKGEFTEMLHLFSENQSEASWILKA